MPHQAWSPLPAPVSPAFLRRWKMLLLYTHTQSQGSRGRGQGRMSSRTDIERLRLALIATCKRQLHTQTLTHTHTQSRHTPTHTHTHAHPAQTFTQAHRVRVCVCVPRHMHVNPCTRPKFPPPHSPLPPCCRTRLLWPITHLSIFTYLDRSCRRLCPPLPLPLCDPKLARWHCVWVRVWLWFWVCARVLAGLGSRASSQEPRAGARLIAEMLPFCKWTQCAHSGAMTGEMGVEKSCEQYFAVCCYRFKLIFI